MIKIKINDGLIDFVEDLLKKHNFGNRGFADGNYEEQKTGLIGQTAIQRNFNLPDPEGSNGFDGGEDFRFNNLVIDVKTMGRKVDPKPEYVNNFIGLQKDYKSEILIFCSFNKITNILTVCGWISKKEFIKKANFYPKGTMRFRDDGTSFITKADLFEIKNKNLNQVYTFNELFTDLTKLKVG